MISYPVMELRGEIRESFERRRRRPLVMEVRDELERMILGGEVPAGARLNEHGLAAQMGVSRAPVREAARSLERDGLVTTVTNEGVYVRKLSLDDAVELYDLRAMMAGYLCSKVAETASDETKSDLRAFVDRMGSAILSEDEEAYFAENLAFHDCIARAAGASRANTIYTALGKEVRLLRLRVLTGHASLVASNTEHDRIVTAIEDGDATAAKRAATEHHLNGKDRLLKTLKQ